MSYEKLAIVTTKKTLKKAQTEDNQAKIIQLKGSYIIKSKISKQQRI